MKNFKIRNLVGVLVVSATVLLTGCNIEALGNFGKATAVLENYNNIFEDSYNNCVWDKNIENQMILLADHDPMENESKKVMMGRVAIDEFCKPFKVNSEQIKIINNNLVVYGKLLAAFEEDANVDFKNLLSNLKEVKSFVSGKDRENLESLGDGFENAKEAETSLNKLVGMIRDGVKAMAKAIMKGNIVSEVSSNLIKSENSVKTSFIILTLNLNNYERRLEKTSQNFNKLEERYLDLAGPNADWDTSKEALRESKEFLDKAYDFIKERKISLQKYRNSLNGIKNDENEKESKGIENAYEKLLVLAKNGSGKNRFDGQGFKNLMADLFNTIKEIFEGQIN